MRTAIVTGQLRPGDALPPGRELARRLGVSRGTVSTAYDRLSGEGFVTARVGAGTFVNARVQHDGSAATAAAGALRPVASWDNIPVPWAFDAPARYDLRTGLPDASRFPFETWRRLVARELRAEAVGRGYYGEPAGHRALREAIARHVGVSRAVATTADDVVVTNGTQQALDVIARVLVTPGDQIAVEDPGYSPAHWLFGSLGLKVAGVRVDADGLVVDELPDAARLVYVTPSHQYPLGVAMSLPRRIALLQWADRHRAAIIEDDYDSEFRYGGRPVEPLHALDTSGRVVYVGSFSKTMLATLRLGFVVAPPSLTRALRTAKSVTDWHTALPAQAALARFIDEGHLARHVRRMRAVYRRRHELIVEVISQQLAEHLTIVPSAAGLHLAATATTASPEDIVDVVQCALADGVAVQTLSTFRVDRPPLPGLALGYGAIETGDIDEGLRRLRRAFEHSPARRARPAD